MFFRLSLKGGWEHWRVRGFWAGTRSMREAFFGIRRVLCRLFLAERPVWSGGDPRGRRTRGWREGGLLSFPMWASACSLYRFFPFSWAFHDHATPVEALGFIWFASPLVIAAYLSFSGSYGAASLLSIGNFVGAIAFSAALIGGSALILAPWLVVAFLLSTLAGGYRLTLFARRRSSAWACCFCFLSRLSGGRGDGLALLQPESVSLLAVLPVGLALFSSMGIAVGAILHRNRTHAALQEMYEDMGRIVDGAGRSFDEAYLGWTGDALPRRRRARLFGAPRGLVAGGWDVRRRVHPADRSRFLRAIARAESGRASSRR